WSLAWVAAGCVAFVLWARAEQVWPFGPKEISEEYAAGADPDAEGGAPGTLGAAKAQGSAAKAQGSAAKAQGSAGDA
ncbi:hypothetical protein KN815_43510, partial [Streptomyces sp. 4503]|nr:hypothetical protein [Streptomyces niphimycinicus]